MREIAAFHGAGKPWKPEEKAALMMNSPRSGFHVTTDTQSKERVNTAWLRVKFGQKH